MAAKLAQGGDLSVRLMPSLVVAVGIASASLGAVLASSALTVAQTAADSNTPSTTSDADAVRRPATIEDSFPSLGTVRARPAPSTSSAERARITNSLVGDRTNAQYTSQALRGGEEAAAPPPRSLPPVAASEIRDPNAERRAAAEAQGVTAFGSYQQRPDGARIPPALPSVPEAESYASRAVPAPTANGAAASVPRAVARPAALPEPTVAADAPAADDPAAARPTTAAVRPLRVPPTVASLPAPAGQEQRPVAPGVQPRVIASIDSSRVPVPSPASVAATRGTTPLPAPVTVADTSGSRYAPPATTVPQLRIAGGAAPAVAPSAVAAAAPTTTAPAPGTVQVRPLVPVVAGASRDLGIAANANPGEVVTDVYRRQLAETRRPTTVPAAMPQFEISSAPALPAGPAIAMTPAMQAALGGSAPARAPVRLDIPADVGPQAAAVPAPRPAPARATTAAVSGGGTVIGFAAGSIDLTPEARESIRQMASALHTGSAQVRIVGYARSRGDAGDSVGAFGLSIDRANAVAAELMAAGVPPRAVMVEAIVADAGAAANRSRGKGPEAVVFVE